MALTMLILAACDLDKEDAVRAQADRWVFLGETIHFNSNRGCTAGLFEAKRIKSSVRTVQDTDRALRLIRQGTVVAFRFPDMSPAEIQQEVDSIDRSVGLAILASGLAVRDCLPEDLKDTFANVLAADDATLIFDPQNSALVLFEPGEKRIFFARGQI